METRSHDASGPAFAGRFGAIDRATAWLIRTWVAAASSEASFDHLVDAREKRRGRLEAKGGRGPEIEDELELRGLLDRKLRRVGVPQSRRSRGPDGATHKSRRSAIRWRVTALSPKAVK